ncbi:MAG TPA: MraY family glycosyltransferase, partial [Solirubrobacteraceae bacterium]|nr:MraY family glycosyltransferase [Solirubrobacteraceae bacterium]
LQFYDEPTGGYKDHSARTPYLGGAAVMTGYLISVLVTAGQLDKTAPLLGGALVLWLVGTIDDRRRVSLALRLLVEVGVAALVWATGLGWHLHAGGAVDLALTCLWVVAVINAFNIFDHMDGAAATMALVVSAGAATIGVVRGDPWLSTAAACLCGACVGFLPRNISQPARIFLGDGGSMPIGFAVAVLVGVAAGTSTAAWRSLPVALLLIGIPALDTTLRIISRRRRGVSVLVGGLDGLAHRARPFLPSARAVALSLGGAQAALSVVAVLANQGTASLVVISASAYLLIAAFAIIALDSRNAESLLTAEQRAGARRLALGKRAVASLTVIGLGAGLSPFFFTYYDSSVWVPIGLALVILAAIAFVLRPTRPSGPGALALFGLLGLGVLSLLSTAWAESAESAVVSGNRWLVYGALLLLAIVLASHERRAAVLLGAAAVGVGAVAISVLARLLGNDPATLFLGGRLNAPLGYINGEGCLFAMGIWPCMALAQLRRPLLAGAGAGLATLFACLALLSQSRGTALAIAFSLVVVLALVPGRVRRAYAALAIAVGLAAAGSALLHVYDHANGGAVSTATAHAAGRAALLAAIGVGLVWAALVAAWGQVAQPPRAANMRTLGAWLLAVPVVAALAAGVASAGRVSHDASAQWHAFVHVAEQGEGAAPSTPSTSQSRLLSGAGNRYDYWRIAVHVWEKHPLIGVGAGNYPRSYFERRATTEDVQQPHSLELQALSELGLAGALLLACFLAGVGWGAVRMRPLARRSPRSRALLTASLGSFSAWLAQDSVDWMHLLPGLTGVALACAAVLTWPRWQPEPVVQPAPSRTTALRGRRPALALSLCAVLVTLIVAGASLSRQGLAQLYRERAQTELARNPAAALSDVNRSLEIDSDAPQSYYIQAAAFAHFDQAHAAEAALARALGREAGNFVTWALLGDVSVRQRLFAAAKRDYTRAHELNPRNATVRELALDPATAVR